MTDFLTLTNRVLRKLNEVELTTTTFSTAQGIHAVARDAVNDAIDEINHFSYKWPFNSTNSTQTLTAGTEEYALPSDAKIVDMQSFHIQKDDTLNVENRYLRPINREWWYRRFRDRDQDSESDGLSIPDYVFKTSVGGLIGFGVTPSPNDAYIVGFRYFTEPTRLSLHGDEPTIPSAYDHVIQAGALWHMYDFLDNTARADRNEQYFEKNLGHMRSILVNDDENMQDTRVRYGTQSAFMGYWDFN